MSASGVTAHPDGTLVERALSYLDAGPAASPQITRDILGIPLATDVVAERLAVALLGADPRVRRDQTGNWRLADARPALTALEDCAFAVVDVETTGSRTRGVDRITEIAVVVVSRGKTETVLETLVNPERVISQAVTRITRITNELVRDQPTFREIADDVLSALAGRVFVAHNVGFDWGFVSREILRARDVRLDGARLCTVRLARRLVPGLKHRGLDSLARYFGLEIEQRHRAGDDARATAGVLLRLLGAAVEQGARTLADLAEMGKRGRGRRRRRRRGPAGPTSMEEV